VIEIQRSRLKKMRRHYKRLLHDFDTEEIHDFRLAFKKLRAFSRLLNDTNGIKTGIGKQLKDFYHLAGKIRNLQISRNRIITLCEQLQLKFPEVYLELLKSLEYSYRAKAIEASQEIQIAQLEDQFHFSENKPEEQQVANFVIRKETDCSCLFTLYPFYDEALHESRKKLKDLIYNCDHIESFGLSPVPAGFLNKENMEVVAEKLGDFQDLCDSLELLEPQYVDRIGDMEEKVILNVIREYLIFLKQELKEELTVLVQPALSAEVLQD
ncbi:MAG TPA: CHAD domain-containing protein, partial [Chitinophagaceae bacterium]